MQKLVQSWQKASRHSKFTVHNRNSRARCEICSKLIKTPELSLLLTLNIFHTLSRVSIVNFEHELLAGKTTQKTPTSMPAQSSNKHNRKLTIAMSQKMPCRPYQCLTKDVALVS